MRFVLLLAAAALFAMPSQSASAIVIADGGSHVVNESNPFPYEAIEVANDSISGDPTLVEVTAAGLVTLASSITTRGTSMVTISGGLVGALGILENGRMEMLSGHASTVFGNNDSQLTLSGGRIGTTLNGFGNANFEVRGGAIGGTARMGDSSTLRVTAGTLSAIRVMNNAVAEIHGGTIEGIALSNDDPGFLAHAIVRGGTFGVPLLPMTSLPGLSTDTDGLITIYGSSFNYPFGDLVPFSGTLAGVLSDGSPLHVSFYRGASNGGPRSDGRITLVELLPVPEPSAGTLVGVTLVISSATSAHRRTGRGRDASHVNDSQPI